MTLSRNAGSGSCMSVFSRIVIDPIGAVNISSHLFRCVFGGSFLQEHITPSFFSSCIFSWEHLHTYMYPFFRSSSAYS